MQIRISEILALGLNGVSPKRVCGVFRVTFENCTVTQEIYSRFHPNGNKFHSIVASDTGGGSEERTKPNLNYCPSGMCFIKQASCSLNSCPCRRSNILRKRCLLRIYRELCLFINIPRSGSLSPSTSKDRWHENAHSTFPVNHEKYSVMLKLLRFGQCLTRNSESNPSFFGRESSLQLGDAILSSIHFTLGCKPSKTNEANRTICKSSL